MLQFPQLENRESPNADLEDIIIRPSKESEVWKILLETDFPFLPPNATPRSLIFSSKFISSEDTANTRVTVH